MALEGVFGRYIHRDSVIHRLDPRVKLVLLFAFIALAFIADGFVGLGVLYVLLLACVALSRIPPLSALKAMVPFLFLLIFPVLFNLFFIAEGEPLVHYGFILITDEGVYRACYMTLRLFFLFASGTLFTLTTSTIAISDAVGALLKPFARFGLPATELAMMVSIALRFVPLLIASYEDIRAAQQARGVDFSERRPMARIRGLTSILVPLFAQAFRHAEDLAVAMESRCYHGGDRTHYRELKMHRGDVVAIVVVVAVALLLVVLRLVV